MKCTAVSVRQLDHKGKPWQARLIFSWNIASIAKNNRMTPKYHAVAARQRKLLYQARPAFIYLAQISTASRRKRAQPGRSRS